MKRVDIQRGLDIAAESVTRAATQVADTSRVALLGRDYMGLKPTLAVNVGDSVAMGDVLFTDRRYTELRVVAPGNGQVEAIHRGPKRGMEALVISLQDDQQECELSGSSVDATDAAAVRATLMVAGMWPALRARPYEMMPPPDATAERLFITAIDTHPLAPDPAPLIAQHWDAFAAGVDKLRLLTPHTYVCAASAEVLDLDLPGVTPALFSGPHPAGLPGTHIHLLAPQAAGVWHIGYQDVITIGNLYLNGRLSYSREVALAGPGGGPPRLLRTRAGAAIADLAPEFDPALLSPGSPLNEARTVLASQFIGRFDNQVWISAPAAPKPVGLRQLWRWLRVLAMPRYAGGGGAPLFTTGMLTVEAFDAVWPLAMPPAALLRALLGQDTQAARTLGAGMLAPEDLALCSYVCPAKQDYGQALRDIHGEMAREG